MECTPAVIKSRMQNKMPICAYTECGQPFEYGAGKNATRRRFCSDACRYAAWIANNPKSKLLVSIQNRRFYQRHRAEILHTHKVHRQTHCECGNRKPKAERECARCAALPHIGLFIDLKRIKSIG